MSKLTNDTPCFNAFIEKYNIGEYDYYLVRSPVENIVFKDDLIEELADAFTDGYNAALKNLTTFG